MDGHLLILSNSRKLMRSEKFQSWSQLVFLGGLTRENCGEIEGRKYDDKMGCARSSSCSFGVLGRKVMRLLSAFCVGDFFPSLCWVDSLTGLIP